MTSRLTDRENVFVALQSSACLDALGPAEQLQVLVQNSAETSPRGCGETRSPSELGVVTDRIVAWREQGG